MTYDARRQTQLGHAFMALGCVVPRKLEHTWLAIHQHAEHLARQPLYEAKRRVSCEAKCIAHNVEAWVRGFAVRHNVPRSTDFLLHG